jgi:hypothetical protein
MHRAYYSKSISDFLISHQNEILGKLAEKNTFSLDQSQRDAWIEEITILQKILHNYQGTIYFEFSIPRMGQRIDVVILIKAVIFVLEFKVGEKKFSRYAVDQVWDYALDLKNFHETSHGRLICPILIATKAQRTSFVVARTPQNDNLLFPINCNAESLAEVIENVLALTEGDSIDCHQWESGRYCPTPTIIEAAMALYSGHSVTDISRNDASSINLSRTTEKISEIIRLSKEKNQKSICFVTGVPGSGKTLVGLNIATTHVDKTNDLYSVYLSGNGPLVAVLREALTRDKIRREQESGNKIKKGEVLSEVKMFIQNVHNFRDDCLINPDSPPIEHVAIFDEAQRAWDIKQTSSFMQQKKNKLNFHQSEPSFLISCLNRHPDWAVILCLVGGGQEINTGEAGIVEWIDALDLSFPEWHVYVSPQLTGSEYGTEEMLNRLKVRLYIEYNKELHLAVSMRSFRTEHVSLLVKQLLDLETNNARQTLESVRNQYPIVISRDLTKAKQWLRSQARGSERYGIVVSSHAERLKPHAIDVRVPVNPVHWFLNSKEDVRSSYYLEDAATEFRVQGLELDWVCVTWDADFRYTNNGWESWSFSGNRWNHINKKERKVYQKNAYRVLLTRARQGMVIVVPPGDTTDPTRDPKFYDSTYRYLEKIGFSSI